MAPDQGRRRGRFAAGAWLFAAGAWLFAAGAWRFAAGAGRRTMVADVRFGAALCGALLSSALLCVIGTADAGQPPVEPTTELAAGGLVFAGKDALVVERKDLVIGIDKIRITYVVRNADATDRTALMVFALPTIDMAALDGAPVAIPSYDPQNPTNFVGFWTMIDGKAAEPEVDINAKALGHVDVTTLLQAHRIPLYPFDADMGETLARCRKPSATI